MGAVTQTEIGIELPTGETIPTLLCEAAGNDPRPAILVAGDIGGARREFIDMIALELAQLGYDAIVPEFFFRQGRPKTPDIEGVIARRATLDDQQVIADLSASIDWLRARPAFSGGRVGTVGFCLGGTFVLNLAAARPDLATVSFYGFPGPTPAKAGVQGPYPLDDVDATSGPLLAFWGDRDAKAGQDNIARYIAAMRARAIDFDAVVYPGLDHAFLMTEWEQDADGHEPAMDAWARTIAFYDAKLAAQQSA
jgi:carboxymethylenebutenolidase